MAENTVSDVVFARIPDAAEAATVAKIETGTNSVFMGMPALADVDRIVTSVAFTDGALIIAAQPDVPRNLTATLTDGDSSVTGVLTITGTDPKGRTVTEVMSPTAGVGLTLTGTKIFASVTSCVVSGCTGETGADVVVIGIGNVIGLPWDIDNAAAVQHTYLGGTRLTPTVATGTSTSGVDASAGTYDGAAWLHCYVEPRRLA